VEVVSVGVKSSEDYAVWCWMMEREMREMKRKGDGMWE
jgi:hypothetical protein